MMHHNNHGNMHGGGGGGPGPQHSGAPPAPMHRHQMHQPMPHQPMPPHQMHHDNRHPMGMTQPNNMGGHGQSMGGMGQPMVAPPMHGPARPPHQIRPMPHHPPAHHNMPPMKTMRRPYHPGGYAAQAMQPPLPYAQLPPPQPQHAAPPPQQPVEVSAEGLGNETPSEPAVTTPKVEGGETSEAPAQHPLANSKEKTPMCLVNELARYNKIKHQYRLTSETGPAHKKIFTVTLRLGENEEYTSEGSSIKRAQHAAASAALARTRYTFPPPKPHAHHAPNHEPNRYTGAVMPTVELNALAMKLCKPAVYTAVPPVPAPPPARFRFRPPYPPYPPPPPYPPHFAQRGMCGPPRGAAPVYRVRVTVGDTSWPGEGPTPQAARHDAAARALIQLRDQLPPEPPALKPAPSDNGTLENKDVLDMKSPVSLVHELALKQGLTVVFNVKSERGPPHMREFVTTCTVGELEVEGEGNGKKMSKKRAAERMVEEMQTRWPFILQRERSRLQDQMRVRKKQLLTKKKPRNLIKENGEACSEAPPTASDSADNPISRLAMARHAERARSPQYSVTEERGAPRRREFVVQCEAPPHRAIGVGPNKKTAKRRAALNVLIAMGLGTPTPDAATKTVPTNEKSADNDHRNEAEPVGGGGGGGGAAETRQPVPGVLMMSHYRSSGQPDPTPNGISETAAEGGVAAGGSAVGAKDQLIYLSHLLGFDVQFSDFPKRNHGEYLSLVALSTVPPVMCHGGGASTQQSHEQCSRAALRALASMGLDTTPAASSTSPKPSLLNGLDE